MDRPLMTFAHLVEQFRAAPVARKLSKQRSKEPPYPSFLGPALALLLLLSGCTRSPDPGAQEVPPGLHAPPGVFADINPRWSHDGREIAFLRATPDRYLQLYVADAALTRPLPQLEAELVSPDRPYNPSLRRYVSPDTLAWSPDDRQIAFARMEWFTFDNGEHLSGTGLWALDRRLGRVTPLALHPRRYRSAFYFYHTPQWSPDGRYLAFVGEGINGQRVLFIHPLTGQRAQEVTPHFDNYEDSDWPAWEPGAPTVSRAEAPALLYRQGVQRTPAVPPTETLRLIRPGSIGGGTGEVWRITAGQYARLLPPSRYAGQPVAPRAGHPAWSPDGRYLAFTLTPDANDFTRYELWVMRRDGTGARRVSPEDGRGYFAPVWIDGGRLGALSPRGRRFAVVTVDITSRTACSLGTIDSADCDWSPDRSRIVYAGPASSAATPAPGPTTLRLFETGLRSDFAVQPLLVVHP